MLGERLKTLIRKTFFRIGANILILSMFAIKMFLI